LCAFQVGEIIGRFEKKGLKLVAMKMMNAPRALLEEHYKDLSSKGFFAGLITYMSSGPVVCLVRRQPRFAATLRGSRSAQQSLLCCPQLSSPCVAIFCVARQVSAPAALAPRTAAIAAVRRSRLCSPCVSTS
jgi:hypothetical protein